MRAVIGAVGLVALACGPSNPCSGHQFDRLQRYSLPYAGRWVVARGDTLTFPDAPQMSDRLRLGNNFLDTTTVGGGRGCVVRGQITVRAPPARPLARRWVCPPEQARVRGR